MSGPTGREIIQTLIEAARFGGWRCTHFRPARTARGWRTPLEGQSGYPDLTIARDGDALAPEVKAKRDRLRDYQRD